MIPRKHEEMAERLEDSDQARDWNAEAPQDLTEDATSYRGATSHSKAHGLAPDRRNQDRDEVAQLQLPLPLAVLALHSGSGWAFEDAFVDGEEPRWFLAILDDGYELQRSGISMSVVASAIEEEVMKKGDARYEKVAGPWVGGLRRRWLQESQEGLPVRWSPHQPDYAYAFAAEVGAQLRKRWLRMLCPESMWNRANAAARMAAGMEDASCSDEALHRERREAADRQLSRSRTPQRRLPGVTRPARGQSDRGGRQEPLGEPTMLVDQEDVALVVRKWLLKRKDGKSLRRLLDNPAAWTKGPGVTVTSSTRSLLSRAGVSQGSAPPSEQEPMDDLDAQFIWRSTLQLDSDEEFEDATPTRFPGFINEPVWSSVYETLLQQSVPDYETMKAALPRCMQMIQQDLQAIVDQVSVDHGFHEGASGSGPHTAASAASASTARPGRDDVQDEVVEVEVDEEGPIEVEEDVTELMQVPSRSPNTRDGRDDAEHGPCCELGAPAAGSHVANPEGVLRGRSAGAAGDDSGQEDACRV
eukprot:s4092_g1.t1